MPDNRCWSVGEPGPLAGERKHLLLGIVQAVPPRRTIAAAVPAVPSPRWVEELRKGLIVLFVGGISTDRDGTVPQHRDDGALVRAERIDAAPMLFAQTFPVGGRDPRTDERIGDDPGFDEVNEGLHECMPNNRGRPIA